MVFYGVNFDTQASLFNMPELSWAYGYLGVWAVMATSIAAIMIFFRKHRWI